MSVIISTDPRVQEHHPLTNNISFNGMHEKNGTLYLRVSADAEREKVLYKGRPATVLEVLCDALGCDKGGLAYKTVRCSPQYRLDKDDVRHFGLWFEIGD